MACAWRNFKNIFSRPLFTIIFRPEMLKFHPYSILTGDRKVGFVIYCVLIEVPSALFLKYKYCEKAIKFDEISQFYLKLLCSVKKSLKISSYFCGLFRKPELCQHYWTPHPMFPRLVLICWKFGFFFFVRPRGEQLKCTVNKLNSFMWLKANTA